MFASARSDATVCLRCQLRRALRQISHGPHDSIGRVQRPAYGTIAGDKRYPHQEDNDNHDSKDLIYRHFRNVWRRSGRLQREESKPIAIKSLGKDSEVIVLRDVLRDRHGLSDQDVSKVEEVLRSPSQTLLATEIEAMASKKQKTPKRDEVNTAIEENKPQEEVLDQADFDKVVENLMNGYTTSQLLRYLRSKRPKATKKKPHTEQLPNSKASDLIDNLVTVPWKALKTEDGLPPPSKALPPHRINAKKRAAVETILREAWDVKIEEESEALGTLELVLSPRQWGLLRTRTASDLFAVMRSKSLHQRSRLEWNREKGAIQIVGPYSEAQDIAGLIQKAFGEVKTHFIWLKDLEQGFGGEEPDRSYDLVLTEQLRRTLMSATSTYIVFDESKRHVVIYSFQEKLLHDAVRLVLAHVSLPTRSTYRACQADEIEGQLVVAPVMAEMSLQARYRSQNLGRLVKVTEDRPKNKASTLKQEELPEDARLVEDLLKIMGHCLCPDKTLDRSKPKPAEQPHVSYWQAKLASSTWQATLGHVLIPRNMSNTAPEKSDHVQSDRELDSFDEERASAGSAKRLAAVRLPPFLAQTPSLAKALSYFCSPKADRPMIHRGTTELVVRLMPSPLQRTNGAETLVNLPAVELVFYLKKAKRGETPSTFHIDGKTDATLSRIQAILHEQVIDAAIPKGAVDLRFVKREIILAHKREAMANQELATFIDAIVSSLRSKAELRAPQFVNLIIPNWMNRDKTRRKAASKRARKTAEHTKDKHDYEKMNSKFKYLFAGLEYRQVKYFRASEDENSGLVFDRNHALRVSSVEGGMGGGKRLEVSVAHARSTAARKPISLANDASAVDENGVVPGDTAVAEADTEDAMTSDAGTVDMDSADDYTVGSDAIDDMDTDPTDMEVTDEDFLSDEDADAFENDEYQDSDISMRANVPAKSSKSRKAWIALRVRRRHERQRKNLVTTSLSLVNLVDRLYRGEARAVEHTSYSRPPNAINAEEPTWRLRGAEKTHKIPLNANDNTDEMGSESRHDIEDFDEGDFFTDAHDVEANPRARDSDESDDEDLFSDSDDMFSDELESEETSEEKAANSRS